MVVRTLAFVIVRRVLGLVGLGPASDAKDIEIAVLRHQLMVVRRQVARPRYAPADRMVLAVLARWLPWGRWSVFLVTPATLFVGPCGNTSGCDTTTGGHGGSWWRSPDGSRTFLLAGSGEERDRKAG
jgi:hypothetical protein